MKPVFAKTELYVDGKWVPGNYPDLKKGDIFRMYNGDKLSVDAQGNSTFVAKADARTTNGFNYTIDCEPYDIKADNKGNA